jgi:hypothetical protein
MTLFETAWCTDTGNRPSLAVAWARALAVAGQLPEGMVWPIMGRKPFRLRQWMTTAPPHEDAQIDRALRKLARDVLAGWQADDARVAAAE